jgi:HEAT repeat protein
VTRLKTSSLRNLQKKASLSSYLFAEDITHTAVAEPLDNNDNALESAALVNNLTDDDPRVRRNARDALIALGAAAVEPLAQAWRNAPDDYDTKLGTVIVMNDMLRNDTNIASKISGKLNSDDIRLLVNALSDSDKTIRLQTTEFLYALKDKRVVDSSLDALRNNTNENGVYNNVLVLKEIAPSLEGTERLRVRNEVMRGVPASYVNTLALARTIDP